MTKNPADYFINGCMRCKLGATPNCKIHTWIEPLLELRSLANRSGLIETAKWGVPCYTLNGKNVLMIGAFKAYCFISFFKGILLEGESNLLLKHGEHSEISRFLKFTSAKQVLAQKNTIENFIEQAIEIERNDVKPIIHAKEEALPEELIQEFQKNLFFKEAFLALTKGRQRGYIIYFSQPKQSTTRTARIIKCIPQILKGEGLHDAYKKANR